MAHQQERNRGVVRVILEQDAGFTVWLSDQLGAIRTRFDALDQRLTQMEKNIMATLDQVLADVTAETTQIDSVITLIKGLRDQVAALPGITPAMQAQIDAIFASVEGNKTKLDNAIAANVQPPLAPVQPAPASPSEPLPAANPASGL